MLDTDRTSAPPALWATLEVRRILVGQLTFGFAWSLYLLNPKFLTSELHAPADVIGRVGAVGGLTGLMIVPFAGYALDRLGRKLFFQVGSLLVVALSLGFLRVHEVSALVYVLQGCLSASFVLAYNALAAMLTDYAPRERIGQAIGWVGGANALMNAVAAMVAEPLAAHYGFRAVFALGAAAGCAALAVSLGLREAPQRRAGVVPPAPPLIAAELPKGIYLVLLSTVMLGGVFIAVFAFVQPYAIELGAERVGGYYVGYTVSAVAGRILLGSLGDRLGRRTVSSWMFVGYGACAFALRQLDIDWLFIYGLAFGAAHGILYPTLNALLLEYLPSARRGLGLVLYNGAFNCGTSFGNLAWGSVAKRHGYPIVYAIATATALAAACLLASVRTQALSERS